MKKPTILSLFLLSIIFTSSCVSHHDRNSTSYSYPESKIWKHGVYSELDAEKYAEIFDGLEVDLIYSAKYSDIYIGREEKHAETNKTFDYWISKIKEPDKTFYWVDFKNLSTENVEAAMRRLDEIIENHKADKRKFMIESQDVNTLKVVKRFDYATILWVDNIYYWQSKTKADTINLCNTIRSQLNELHPNAISGSYTAYPLLCDSFPEQNIHFWDTPKKYSEKNAAFTQKLCRKKNVKVVLVDYSEPIDY